MALKYMCLEDTQARIKEAGLFNHSQMETQLGENYLIDCLRDYKDFSQLQIQAIQLQYIYSGVKPMVEKQIQLLRLILTNAQ